ncbi:thioredoxin family protein [Zeimonas arvi]|uniref:Thioredoxin domain-containing protein n=1 Tax=Zeimonas arvi TaxID=2498847 RepID=A0A5C8NPX1_9BURK|nr:thioredoxin fold domain-containing protein [Zeimonas arvi]TXL63834.1 hypothetical protein FHP08_16190 [Zeimonas arvi]
MSHHDFPWRSSPCASAYPIAGALAIALLAPAAGVASGAAPGGRDATRPTVGAPAASTPAGLWANTKVALPRPASWKAVLAESRATGRPIVLMFSSVGCAWCERVRRDHLRYLARDQQKLGLIVVELDLLDRKPFADGETPAGIAKAMGVRVAPTVAFLGPEGELAERLLGYQSADFYGAYLDDRIAEAAAKLKQQP